MFINYLGTVILVILMIIYGIQKKCGCCDCCENCVNCTEKVLDYVLDINSDSDYSCGACADSIMEDIEMN